MFKFLKRYNELVLLPIAILLWVFSPDLFHYFDPTAATYDVAVFQKLIFGLIVFGFSTFNAWILLRLTFPGVFKFLTEDFDKHFINFSNLTQSQCEQLKVSLAVFSLYLLGLLLAMLVL